MYILNFLFVWVEFVMLEAVMVAYSRKAVGPPQLVPK